MTPIAPIRTHIAPVELPSLNPKPAGEFFSDHLKATIDTVESLGKTSAQTAERFLNGEGEELHNVAVASQKAALSFELFMQVRNKVVQAYQEVMRMQV